MRRPSPDIPVASTGDAMATGHDAALNGSDARRVLLEGLLTSVEGADHAAFSRPVGSGSEIVATSEVARMLQSSQHAPGGDGPAADALRGGEIERINYLSNSAWPEFGARCEDCGVHSVAAFPISAAGEVVGVLTLYSEDHHAFGASELRCGRDAAAALGASLADHGAT